MSIYSNPTTRRSSLGNDRNVSKLEDKLTEGIHEASMGVEQGIEQGKERTRRVMESVKKGAHVVKEKMANLDRESVRDSLRRAQGYARRAQGYAKENPGKVVLASLALGWIVGALRARGPGKV